MEGCLKTLCGLLLIILSIVCFASGSIGLLILGIVLDILGLICLDFDPSNTTTWIFWDF